MVADKPYGTLVSVPEMERAHREQQVKLFHLLSLQPGCSYSLLAIAFLFVWKGRTLPLVQNKTTGLQTVV